ncbi:MAG: Hsp33 family molecular chaperone HslO, partial [Beijerinckiaceae bacterium]
PPADSSGHASMRAYARFDADKVAQQTVLGKSTPADLLGKGHLGFTIDRGPQTARYQGIVELSGQGFEAAAHEYFLRSEQIPTRVRLAVAESLGAADENRWRAGGVMVQFLPVSPDRQRQRDLDPGDAPDNHRRDDRPDDDAWVEARSLTDTVEDHELVDPTVTREELLFRLFHERGVRVFESVPLSTQCRCSREKIDEMLRRFSAQERRDMVADDGQITVTCEFCSTHYRFRTEDFPETESAPQ